MRLLALAAVLLAAGCAARVHTIHTTDGGQALYAECPRTMNCHEAATGHCPGGYTVLDESHSSSVFGYGGNVMPIEKTRLTFRCN